jgi:high affinity Mn2+ porin
MHRVVTRYHKSAFDVLLGLMLRVSLRPPASVQEGQKETTAKTPIGKSRPHWRVLVAFLRGAAFILIVPQAFGEEAEDERYIAHGQFTHIWHRKDAFRAAYTNLNGSPNSLVTEKERSYTTTATAFLGLKTWQGGEIYFAPEMISELPLSQLRGLGGSVQNAELEKNGARTPTFYRSRLFLRQTWGLGGESTKVESGQLQLAKSVDSRRLVLTAGNLAIIDIFDKNSYAGDVRQQFLNMNFLTYAAYDFAADARGYSWGVAGEYYHDDWALRLGRFIGPRDPNQLQLNYSIMNFHGDQIELEHKHELYGQPGKVRVLAYRNVFNQGRWDDAINAFRADLNKNATTCTGFNYGSGNDGAPDLCWVRKRNTKVGIGVNLEQGITPDVGVFFRGMKSDGKTEVYAFTSTDSSISFGSLVKGSAWGRERDTVGIGYAKNWLSKLHVAYLNMGGIDGFIGDGRISYKPERVFEAFYNFNVNRYLWITANYQHITNPAYNLDRGPVNLYGVRFHAEF